MSSPRPPSRPPVRVAAILSVLGRAGQVQQLAKILDPAPLPRGQGRGRREIEEGLAAEQVGEMPTR